MDPVDEAFAKIQRKNFVLDEHEGHADIDAPLPIGFGQTISQPTTVRMMLNWLEVEPGNKILDVGSGSGWTTALLSELAGPTGKIYAVERISELVKFGQDNNERIGVTNAEFHQASTEFGLPKHAPYDRILVSASAGKLPRELLDQLKPGGKLVIPVRNDILEIEKTPGNNYDIQEHSGFVFVPLL